MGAKINKTARSAKRGQKFKNLKEVQKRDKNSTGTKIQKPEKVKNGDKKMKKNARGAKWWAKIKIKCKRCKMGTKNFFKKNARGPKWGIEIQKPERGEKWGQKKYKKTSRGAKWGQKLKFIHTINASCSLSRSFMFNLFSIFVSMVTTFLKKKKFLQV